MIFLCSENKVTFTYTPMCEILLQSQIMVLYFNIFCNVIYSSDGKAEFPVSHNSAEIILIWC